MKSKLIYHIVPEKEFLSQTERDKYFPASFSEFGFVHCALEISVIPVANDYYSDVQDVLLLLAIDSQKLFSETKYESAMPDSGAGTEHLSSSPVFPHVYGPIDTLAIERVGILQKENNKFHWPRKFISLSEYLEIKRTL